MPRLPLKKTIKAENTKFFKKPRASGKISYKKKIILPKTELMPRANKKPVVQLQKKFVENTLLTFSSKSVEGAVQLFVKLRRGEVLFNNLLIKGLDTVRFFNYPIPMTPQFVAFYKVELQKRLSVPSRSQDLFLGPNFVPFPNFLSYLIPIDEQDFPEERGACATVSAQTTFRGIERISSFHRIFRGRGCTYFFLNKNISVML
jgi:hypothetical protein